MNKLYVSACIFLTTFTVASSQGDNYQLPYPDHCPKDQVCIQGCPDIYCQFGVVPDPCACCPVCAQGPGRYCAGPNNSKGFCAKGLVCRDRYGNEIPSFYRGPNTPVGTCLPRRNGNGASIREGELVHVILNRRSNAYNNGNSCPPDCSTVTCPTPEDLGCPYNFRVEFCKCCPVCVY